MKGTELFGYTLRDRITGFEGVANGYCVYSTGCSQILLSPKVDEKGDLREGKWFDEQRLLLLPAVDQIVMDNGDTPGCDIPAPVK